VERLKMFSCGEKLKTWAEKSHLPCWFAPVTDSTNKIAKENVFSDSPITLYTTDHQSQGKGRNTNTWQDTGSGEQMLVSWVFLVSKAPQPVLAPALGAAVYTALCSTFPWLKWSMKAPNDIYLDGKKVAGLLIENVQQGDHHRLIVGLGLNIFKSPGELATATCIADKWEITETNFFNILDRLLLEMSLTISQTRNELSPILCETIKHALNGKFDRIDPDGSLWQGNQKTNWSEL
jgi:BirA family transcriptional regulator, biotin operon repressor / biotin---[acetyl-CoA-carboxylase] ligase